MQQPGQALTNRRLLVATVALAFGSAVAGLMAVAGERANAARLADFTAAAPQSHADLEQRTDRRLADLERRTDPKLADIERQLMALRQDNTALRKSVEDLQKALAQTQSDAVATRDALKVVTGVLDALRPLWKLQEFRDRLDAVEALLKKLMLPMKPDQPPPPKGP